MRGADPLKASTWNTRRRTGRKKEVAEEEEEQEEGEEEEEVTRSRFNHTPVRYVVL